MSTPSMTTGGLPVGVERGGSADPRRTHAPAMRRSPVAVRRRVQGRAFPIAERARVVETSIEALADGSCGFHGDVFGALDEASLRFCSAWQAPERDPAVVLELARAVVHEPGPGGLCLRAATSEAKEAARELARFFDPYLRR